MPEVDTLKISNDDAAFILGKGGKTKEKLARVSGARIELYERSHSIEIMGPPEARARAKKYVEAVMAQRVGPVSIDEEDGEDLTTVLVPHEAVGFVTGSQGNFLRSIEDEWGTLMFFAEYRGRRGPSSGMDTEKLAIFGPRRARRGAHLKVLAAVETKVGGFASGVIQFADDDADFGTETRILADNELSYALGKKGGTRKKLAASSECIVEYVGNTVYMCGTTEQRTRAAQYLDWLFAQLKGPVFVDYADRNDCTVVEVPRDTVGYVTGARRATLGRIEEEWGTRARERAPSGAQARRGRAARVRETCPPRAPPVLTPLALSRAHLRPTCLPACRATIRPRTPALSCSPAARISLAPPRNAIAAGACARATCLGCWRLPACAVPCVQACSCSSWRRACRGTGARRARPRARRAARRSSPSLARAGAAEALSSR
jgi:rRNA processing protein Krr1/Pno1